MVVQAGVDARAEFRLANPPRFLCSRSDLCFAKVAEPIHVTCIDT